MDPVSLLDRMLHADARPRVAAFRRVMLRHALREQNAEAGALANRGVDEGGG